MQSSSSNCPTGDGRAPPVLSNRCNLLPWPALRAGQRSFSTQSKLSWDAVLSASNRKSCVVRLSKGLRQAKSDHPCRRSAVLVPLCHHKGALSLLYTVRSTSLRKHTGEVSFPGGLEDPEDGKDLCVTALRETKEEIGLEGHSIDIWGPVPPIPSRPGDMSISGVLAYVGHLDLAQLALNEGEVSQVFCVPLQQLSGKESFKQTQFRALEGASYTLPVFVGPHPRIWGLTAVLTHMTLKALLPGLYRHTLRHIPLLQ